MIKINFNYLKFYSYLDLNYQIKNYLNRFNNIPIQVLGWLSPTSGSIKTYTFLDGTNHVLFNDEWDDPKMVHDYKLENKSSITNNKPIQQINLLKAHKTSNSLCRKGLPPLVSYNNMYYSINLDVSQGKP